MLVSSLRKKVERAAKGATVDSVVSAKRAPLVALPFRMPRIPLVRAATVDPVETEESVGPVLVVTAGHRLRSWFTESLRRELRAACSLRVPRVRQDRVAWQERSSAKTEKLVPRVHS
jgi:hypothetical protein